MKRIFTFLIIVVITRVAICQTPITITAQDIPIPTSPFIIDEIALLNPPNPSEGSNQTWNYSAYFANNLFANNYIVETDPYFTDKGVDLYLDGSKAFNQQFYYNIANEYDLNDGGFDDVAMYVYPQAYGLANFTGNPKDTLAMPVQAMFYTNPRPILKFPCTANSSWSSDTRRAVDFYLTVAAFNLNKIACQHIFHSIRKDTIAGWGKMKVYTPNGPSKSYDVLMSKTVNYAIDSFFVGGAPAPKPLLDGFSVSQGQISDESYSINFYRKGAVNYLARFFYAKDKTYKVLNAAYINLNDIEVGTATNEENSEYSTLLFPNPSNGSDLNLKFIGKTIGEVNYTITDLNGKILRVATNVNGTDNHLKINLDGVIPNGNYIINVTDRKNKQIATEQFSVQK